MERFPEFRGRPSSKILWVAGQEVLKVSCFAFLLGNARGCIQGGDAEVNYSVM